MGNWREELTKFFAKAQRKQAPIAAPPVPLEARRANAEAVPQPNWKAGVTPLRPPKQVTSEQRGKPPKALRLPGDAGPRDTMSPQAPTTAPSLAWTPSVKVLSTKPEAQARRAPEKQSQPQKSTVPAPAFGTFRPPSLTRDQEFKKPDVWVLDGIGLQPPGGHRGRALSVRIGIDFGTAYTKVAIRVADQVLFVPWDGLRQSEVRYFLPGEIARAADDSMWLGRMPDADEIRSDLKLPFVTRVARSQEHQAAAVAFLAWIMRYARAWLYHAHEPLVRNRTLAWEVNLGCPTNSWSASDLRTSYEGIGFRAWRLSQTAGDISWERALASLSPLGVTSADIGLDGLKLMPEFIAQIAGYVRSPQRRNGLHLLMDVGAGTVDVAMFNVTYDEKKEEDRYPIFASDVLPLGTHFLMEARLRRLGLGRGAWDDLQAVPDPAEIARQLSVEAGQVQRLDEEFVASVSTAVQKILNYTHNQRYGKAPEWREGLPAFLSGGGSNCELYSRSLSMAFARHGVKLKRTNFPLLEEAEGALEQNFHRLSVAYGLTFDAESIGRILCPHEVEDAPRFDPAVDMARTRPDRDDLYPK